MKIDTTISFFSAIIALASAFFTYKELKNSQEESKNDFLNNLTNNLKELKLFILEIKPESSYLGLTERHHIELEKIRNYLLYQQSIIEKYLNSDQKEKLYSLQSNAEDIYGYVISNHLPEIKKRKLIEEIDTLISFL
jgi:hypothetical protein